MVRSGRPDSTDGQQSLGELVAQAAKDMSSLVQYEISLAKSELRMDARRIGIAAVLGVVSLFVTCLIVVLLCFAYAYGLVAAGIWEWAAFLIVAGTCLLLIALAGLDRVPQGSQGDRHEDDPADRDGRPWHVAQERAEPEWLRAGGRQPGGQRRHRHYGRNSARATVTAGAKLCRQRPLSRSPARGRTAR